MYIYFHGEKIHNVYVDQILRSYFPDFSYKGVFFDVGAYDPITISNSHHFHMNNWNVFAFEANPNLISRLKSYRQNVYNYGISDVDTDDGYMSEVVSYNNPVINNLHWTASFSCVGEINKDYINYFGKGNLPNDCKVNKINIKLRTLNTIIEKEINNIIGSIDILSIDTEGSELLVLKGIDLLKYKPKVIVVEAILDNINKIHDYLVYNNYKLDKHVAYNYFYKLN
jgi:FkbM family methyltransferase